MQDCHTLSSVLQKGRKTETALSLLHCCPSVSLQLHRKEKPEFRTWQAGLRRNAYSFYAPSLFQFFAHHFIEESDLNCLGHLLCNSSFRILKFPSYPGLLPFWHNLKRLNVAKWLTVLQTFCVALCCVFFFNTEKTTPFMKETRKTLH